MIVTDPSGAAVPNGTVSIGAIAQPTYDGGVTTFCGLGDGPHSVVALAPDLRPEEVTVQRSSGEVRIALALAVVTEQIVVVGSRTEGRAVLESAVPVDIVSAEDFAQQGDPDLVNQLRNTVPSFNVSVNPISDGGTIVCPASLRNLAPDHTLVLVNGKRRHRAAIIHWLSIGPTDGAQGPHIAAIPSIAIKQAEVLRDGASAQYGSDAIAGALNFVLKDASSGGSVQVTAGGLGEGDGTTVTFAGNAGLPLGEGGFANLSVEYGNSDPTSRSVQRYDARQLIANGNIHVRSPVAQIWGMPTVDDDAKFWGNFGKYLRGSTQLYGNVNYASKRVEGGFYSRNPHTRSGVFGRDGNLLVGDLLDAEAGVLDGSAGCPPASVANGAELEHAPFDEVLSKPDCFTFHQPFAGAADGLPGGFTPQFGGYARDSSAVGGMRGTLGPGIVWDASVGLGSNATDFFIYNTVNASIGPDSPTEFDPGKYTQNETNFNFDMSYAASDTVHVAAGAEWRNEQFLIGAGEAASWQFGPLALQGFSAGSNGFPGFSPIAVGEWNRSNYAVYSDIEIGGPDRPYTLGGAPGRAVRRLRVHRQLQVRGPRRDLGRAVPLGQREQRVPRPDPGAAERVQCDKPVRPGRRRHHQLGHDPLHFGRRAARGRRAAEAREVEELHRGGHPRDRSVQLHGGLLPCGPAGPPVVLAKLHAVAGSSRVAGGRGRHERGEPRHVPLLHQPDRDTFPRGGHGGHSRPAGAGRQDRVQLPAQPHQDRRDVVEP